MLLDLSIMPLNHGLLLRKKKEKKKDAVGPFENCHVCAGPGLGWAAGDTSFSSAHSPQALSQSSQGGSDGKCEPHSSSDHFPV